QHVSAAPHPAGVAAHHRDTLARAIAAADQRGIVHRDLRPTNILLSTESKVPSTESEAAASPAALSTQYTVLSTYVPKITDFGLAKLLDSESGQTSTGVPLGTPC